MKQEWPALYRENMKRSHPLLEQERIEGAGFEKT
jgi:hypothetical protein